VKSWEPNKLVQDEQDVAYEPTDKKGKQLARALTMQLRLIMWRAKIDATRKQEPYDGPSHKLNCRCMPLKPLEP
jgi:hypothetical protein